MLSFLIAIFVMSDVVLIIFAAPRKVKLLA